MVGGIDMNAAPYSAIQCWLIFGQSQAATSALASHGEVDSRDSRVITFAEVTCSVVIRRCLEFGANLPARLL
jgi:hypothetical protein